MTIKNKLEKLSFLHSIKKEVEIHSLLAEILPKLGFKDVAITHERGNDPENGKSYNDSDAHEAAVHAYEVKDSEGNSLFGYSWIALWVCDSKYKLHY